MAISTRYETRGVLAGAYVNEKTLLTHLCDTEDQVKVDEAMCGRAKNLCDVGGLPRAQWYARPTCPRCAKHWDRLSAEAAQ
jgi:hypothetical protein